MEDKDGVAEGVFFSLVFPSHYCIGICCSVSYAVPTPLRQARYDTARFHHRGKHAPWYVALEKGFYAKRGLAPSIQASTGSADTVRTVASGVRILASPTLRQ
jgi:ABC-type nitrate/sulfonate/bicarbonate transport system substrate-binding protein